MPHVGRCTEATPPACMCTEAMPPTCRCTVLSHCLMHRSFLQPYLTFSHLLTPLPQSSFCHDGPSTLQREEGLTLTLLLLDMVLAVGHRQSGRSSHWCCLTVSCFFPCSMCHWGPAARTRQPANPAVRWGPGAGIPLPPAPTSSRISETTVYSRPSAKETLPR